MEASFLSTLLAYDFILFGSTERNSLSYSFIFPKKFHTIVAIKLQTNTVLTSGMEFVALDSALFACQAATSASLIELPRSLVFDNVWRLYFGHGSDSS